MGGGDWNTAVPLWCQARWGRFALLGQAGSFPLLTTCRHTYANLGTSSRAECISMGPESCRRRRRKARAGLLAVGLDPGERLRTGSRGTSIGPFRPRSRKPVSTTVHREAQQWGECVVGPLGGHHNESYAVRMSHDSGSGIRDLWVKLRAPQSGVIRYDQRCFKSEEALLIFLQERVPRIPRVIGPESVIPVHSFIEGLTLGSSPEARGRSIPSTWNRSWRSSGLSRASTPEKSPSKGSVAVPRRDGVVGGTRGLLSKACGIHWSVRVRGPGPSVSGSAR